MLKADKEEVNADSLDLEEEEEGNISDGTSTGDLPIFTPRSSQADHAFSTPFLPMQVETSFLPPSTTSFMWVTLHTSDDFLHTLTLWPDAWATVGDLRKLPLLGHSHYVLVVVL